MEEVTTIGLDLAKSVFQVHGVDAHGKMVVRRQLRRAEVLSFFAKLPPCLIGMEACAGAHHVGRQLAALGHDVRLLPAQYVKPFLKGHKRYHDGHGGGGADLGGGRGSNSELGNSVRFSGN